MARASWNILELPSKCSFDRLHRNDHELNLCEVF
jgi:hypothetical protein